MSLDVGSVKGSIVVGDEFSAAFAAVDASIVKLRTDFDSLSAKVKDYSSKTKTEVDKVKDAYNRLAASLDPAVAGVQKLAKAHEILTAALSKGFITQSQHNELLEKAKAKYSNLENPLITLRSRVGELTEAIGKFGGSAGESLAAISDKLADFAQNGIAAVASLGPLIAVVAAVAVAGAGIKVALAGFDFLKTVIADGLEAQQVVEQLNQTLRTNGSASGLSAAQMIEYAGALTLVTGRSDEAIAKGEGILSRFDNIGQNVFPRATRAALDLSQATGKDLYASFGNLGKVLEGSTRGLRSYQEAGIVLTRGQVAMAEEMIKTGRIAEYQEIILSAVEEKVGGAAEAFGRTLPGQLKIAQETFGNFKEEIASEIIPALEDLVNTTIDNAGGWESLSERIMKAAHQIGDVIRVMVYSVTMTYHEWAAQQDALGAAISAGFEKIDNAIAIFARAMSAVPAAFGGGQVWADIANGMTAAAARMGAEAEKSAASAFKHGQTYIELGKRLAQHRLALEGDTNVIKKNGSALDELGEKTKKQKDFLVDLEKSIRSITEAREALLLKSKESLADSERLLGGLLQGIEVYEQVKRSIAGEKEQRALLAPLIKQHSDLISKNAEVVAKLTEEYGANSPKIREANAATQKEIALNLQARETIIARSTALAANTQVIADWTEWQKRSSDAAHAWADSTGKALLSIIQLRKQLASDLSSANAGLLDWQEQAAATKKYGSEIAALLSQYGLLNTASRELAIQEKIRAEIERASIDASTVWGKAQIALIATEIRANEEKIASIKTVQLISEQAAQRNQELLESVTASLTDGVINLINDQLLGDGEKTKEYWENFKRSAIDAVQAWLRSWLQAQVVAQIAGKKTAESTTGGGGSTTSSVGSGISSAYSGAGGSAVTNVGVALIVAIWSKVLTGLYEGFTRKNARSGEATFGDLGARESGDSGLAGRASQVIAELVKQIESLSKEWHLGLVKLTSGSVTVAINSDGDYVVKTLIDSFGKVFHSLEEASDYARVQALKFADLSNVTDKIIADAIHASRALTTEGLKEDIDFATRNVLQNMPEVGRQIREYTQTFVDDVHRAFELFGRITFGNSGSNFAALAEATSSSILFFTTSIQGLYDQLTGHKQDAAQLAEAQRVAFNAQRAIMIAQITLLIAETQARIAAYQVALATGRGSGVGGGGGVTGGGGRGGGGTISPSRPITGDLPFKDGGPAPFDPRNPSNDAGLQALLTVLDNLARALQGLPPEIGEGGVKVPRGGGGSGGGTQSTISDLRQMIEEVNRAVAQSKLSELARQIADINKKWDDEIDKLGGGSKALARITKARDEAIKAAHGNKEAIDKANEAYRRQLGHIAKTKEALDEANAARAAEIALAREQATQKLRDGLRAYTSEFGFSDWQKKQAANERQHQQDIKDRAGTGVPKWQVELANRNRQIELVGEAIGSLGLPLETAIASGKRLAGTVDFLRASMADGSLSVGEFNSVFGQLIDQSKLDLLGLAERIAQSAGDSIKAAEIKAKMDEINFAIQKAQFNIILTQYEALGLIAGKDREDLEALRVWINGLHPDFAAQGSVASSDSLSSSADTISSATSSFQSAVDQFKQATDSLLASFNSLFGSTNQLGGSAQDRLAIAQQQFRSIEQGALAGDVTARGQYGAAAENYLNVLNEANAGGALFGAERDRLRAEFEQLLAMTRFTLNGVSYDSRLGAPIGPVAPVSVGGQPNVGGYTGPVTVPSSGSGSLSSDVTGVLQQILIALTTGNANTTPVLNSVSNNTAKATTSTLAVNANLERLIAAVYQWLNAA